MLSTGFNSVVVVAAVAVLVMTVPSAVAESMCTTIVNVALSALITVVLLNVIAPVPPTAGAVVIQPLPVVTVADTNVVLAGTVSVTVTVCASEGPLITKFSV